MVISSIFSLPGAECEGSGDGDTTAGEILVGVIAIVASLAAIAAGGYQLGRALLGGEGIGGRGAIATAVALGAGIVATFAVDLGDGVSGFWAFELAGAVAAGALLAILGIAALAGGSLQGLRLPTGVYLLSAGLCVYPGVALFALGVNRGGFC